MKKKLLLLGVVGICLAILTSGTVAYFTAEDTSHNVITSGGIEIAIIDKTEDENGMLVDFPEDGLIGIMPGTGASRVVSVRNTGGSEAWIRVKVTQEILSEDGARLSLLVKENIPAITFAVDEEKWTLKEGWYYYCAPVSAGTVTDVLFEQVDFSALMDNGYQNSKADMKIFAQAVQTANNGSTALDAVGWPPEVIEQ